MRRSDVFPSKYLTCDDIPDEGWLVTIDSVTEEKMRDGKPKPVITFLECDKPMVCNVTNWTAIEKLYGEESDDWEGKQITLYPSVTSFEGEEVGCIRVRTKTKKPKEPKASKAVPVALLKTQLEGEEPGVPVDDDPPF